MLFEILTHDRSIFCLIQVLLTHAPVDALLWPLSSAEDDDDDDDDSQEERTAEHAQDDGDGCARLAITTGSVFLQLAAVAARVARVTAATRETSIRYSRLDF